MRCLKSMLVLAVILAAAPIVYAQQQYPTKPIRIIVPFPPADSLDIMSRLIGPKITERLGQTIVVDNRAGAAGQLGLDLAKHAPADGYTLVGGQGGNLVVQPHTYKKLPYDPFTDFAPIAVSTTNFLALVVNPGGPHKTLQELLSYAKANPGKLTLASNGEGGWPHMSLEMMRMAGGFTYLHVPYKGSVQIITEIMGGRVDGTILGIGAIATYIKAGKLRLLAVTSPTRVDMYPDTPAIAEFLPGYDSRGWFGYLAPARTPEKIIMLLNQEINRAMTAPDIKEKMTTIGLTVVAEPPEFFAKLLKTDYEKYGKLCRDIGLQPQ